MHIRATARSWKCCASVGRRMSTSMVGGGLQGEGHGADGPIGGVREHEYSKYAVGWCLIHEYTKHELAIVRISRPRHRMQLLCVSIRDRSSHCEFLYEPLMYIAEHMQYTGKAAPCRIGMSTALGHGRRGEGPWRPWAECFFGGTVISKVIDILTADNEYTIASIG